jgi:hypothetical protein
MKRKTRKIKSRRVDRDMFGTPKNRAKTWGREETQKKNRVNAKKDIQEEMNG